MMEKTFLINILWNKKTVSGSRGMEIKTQENAGGAKTPFLG
jgi:hypothetical protein